LYVFMSWFVNISFLVIVINLLILRRIPTELNRGQTAILPYNLINKKPIDKSRDTSDSNHFNTDTRRPFDHDDDDDFPTKWVFKFADVFVHKEHLQHIQKLKKTYLNGNIKFDHCQMKRKITNIDENWI
jgi:hypothetical protein